MIAIPDYRPLFSGEPITGTEAYTGDYTIERREIGSLNLPTGQIVANDPLAFWETEPLTRKVNPGTYPVSLYVAHFSKTNDQRVAYALLQFQPETPTAWELAVYSGQDITTLGREEYFGYGVDSGTGSFMDAAAAQHIKQLIEREPKRNPLKIELTWKQPEKGFVDLLIEALDTTYKHTYSWANYVLDADTGLNMIAFSSGWGDGSYPSFWGLDTNGDVLCLLTDFCMFWPDDSDE
jgi:hypothetical protein